MTEPEFNQSFAPLNTFTDTSPETQELLGDISKIIGGQKQGNGLTPQMHRSAVEAGTQARSAKTVESEQQIYKNHLKTASSIHHKTESPLTSGQVTDWERVAKASRNAQ